MMKVKPRQPSSYCDNCGIDTEATKCYLYRHFDEYGNLLYVGITNNMGTRISQHTKRSEWFDSVSSITIEKFRTRDEALIAERDAAVDELPIHNSRLVANKKIYAEINIKEAHQMNLEIIDLCSSVLSGFCLSNVEPILKPWLINNFQRYSVCSSRRFRDIDSVKSAGLLKHALIECGYEVSSRKSNGKRIYSAVTEQ